jgi:hypothetical protein
MNAKIVLGIICGFATTGLFFLGCQYLNIPSENIIWGGAFAGGASISPVIFKYLMKLDVEFVKNN